MAKKTKTKAKIPEKDNFKRQEVVKLTLTKVELVHLRDMLSIVLPPDAKKTVSQALAEAENRTMNESKLWGKITDACSEVGLPVGDAAPDYVVAPLAAPPLGVFQLAADPVGEDASPGLLLEGDEKNGEEAT